MIVHESDVRCIITVTKGVLVVHDTPFRCQMYYYCNQRSVTVVHDSDVRCIITVIKGVLTSVHESDVRCIITVRKGVLMVHE